MRAGPILTARLSARLAGVSVASRMTWPNREDLRAETIVDMGFRPVRPATSVFMTWSYHLALWMRLLHRIWKACIAAYQIWVGSMSQSRTRELVKCRFGRHAASWQVTAWSMTIHVTCCSFWPRRFLSCGEGQGNYALNCAVRYPNSRSDWLPQPADPVQWCLSQGHLFRDSGFLSWAMIHWDQVSI